MLLNSRHFASLFFMLSLLFSQFAVANFFESSSNPFGKSQQDGPLPVEEAFVFSPEVGEDGRVVLRWQIPEGYYLYRDRVQVTPPDTIEVVSRSNSTTDTKDDPLFGTVEVFHYDAEVALQLKSLLETPADGVLSVSYQGCWEGGICYPPVSKELPVSAVPAKLTPVSTASVPAATTSKASGAPVSEVAPRGGVSEQDKFAQLLSGKDWLLTLGAFFLAGLALSLTPCVFPMIPIISSIIAGHGHRITTRKALGLSTVYVLAVSVTYTIAGVLAGLFGENLQAAFQNPWIIGFFSAVFVALALSMFGFYDLQLPASWQSRLSQRSNDQKGGTVTGVAVMGLLSALIVGPCMAAPLAGALIYIGQSGDPVMGGAALFALSMGMGVPILLVGTSAGKLLPKAGLWMDSIKAGFGVLLILMAIWMLDRVVSAQVTMALTAIVLITTAIYMRALDQLSSEAKGWHRLWKGMGVLMLLYGVALMIGLLSGASSMVYPLQSLASANGAVAPSKQVAFTKVTTMAQLEPLLADAKQQGKPVMLDFYADWCVSCVELDTFTFSDAAVQRSLDAFVSIKIDVTSNDDAAKALNKAYSVIGPPALIFYDAQGELRSEYTVIGMISADDFIGHIAPLAAR